MANNQYVNKVEFAGQTLMDITGDTVTSSDVLNGVTFHDRSGAPQTGGLITHDVYDGLDSTSATDALSAKQGKALNDAISRYEYSSGETVNYSSYFQMGYGYVSGASKAMLIHFPSLSKRIPDGKTITISTLKLIIRGTQGYVDIFNNTDKPDVIGRTGYTISNIEPRWNGVFITITKSTELTNVMNNTPIIVQAMMNFTVT